MTAARPSADAQRALRALFRRLGRIAIEAGVTAPEAYRLMKEALVDAAERDFSLDERRLTDSRISVLTGVHRKDVRAIRTTPRSVGGPPRKPSLLATVIGRWIAHPDYQRHGTPIPLPRVAAEGPSFDRLVEDVTADVRPRTLLDELVRKGAVALDEAADTVTLTERAMIGSGASEDAFHFLETNVGDHIAAVSANMAADGAAPMLERAVFYSGLDAGAVDALQALCREKGAAVVEAVNEAALERQGEEGDQRFRFGVYFYRETESDGEAG